MSTVEDNKVYKDRDDWICKFQFFDRNLKKWSEMLSPQIGFGETFVQDETTDDASLNFKWRSSVKPNIQHMQWARILHFHKGDNMVATYDENGLPLNHNQYVIGDFQMAQSKDKSYWLVKLSLLEPIERMKFVVGETLAYTNQTSKTVTDGSGNTVTYIKEPYNHLTALERFLKVTPANCDNYDDGYNPHNNISWFNRVKIHDKDFLKTIPFDSDSFTEPDLYTILFKYDKSTGRTPCMYFDIDTETDLPRNLDRDEYLLKFLRQDGFDKPVLKLSDITEHAQNVTYKSSLANFATGVVSNVENLVTGSNLSYPSRNFWAAPELNTTQRDTTTANTPDSGWGIKFPCPIKKINKIRQLKLYQVRTPGTGTNYRFDIGASVRYDLEQFCYEKQEFDSLDKEFLDKNNNLFYYTEGDNFMYIKNYYYKPPNNDEGHLSYWFYIEFEPLLNPKLELGDTEYQTIYNQVDSQIDVYKYYRYLYKYLQSMGKSDLTIIKKHYHPDEMYEIGSLVNDEESGKKYMITGSSYQNLNFELLAVYQLNENHFRRSNSVKANKAIRNNTSISYENLKDRKTCFNNVFQVSFDKNKCSNLKKIEKEYIFTALLNKNIQPINGVLISTLSNLVDNKSLTHIIKKYFYIPLSAFVVDKAVILNFQFLNNTFAGNKKNIPVQYDSYFHTYIYSGYIDSQLPILYTDPFGEIQKLSIYLANISSENIDDYIDINDDATDSSIPKWKRMEGELTSEEAKKFFALVNQFKTITSIPIIETEDALEIINTCENKKENINIYFDMLEKLNISIINDIESDEDIVICDGLSNLSAYINRLTYNDFYIFKSNRNLNIEDIKNITGNEQFSFKVEEDKNIFKITLENIEDSYKAIVLYRGNDALLIINNIDRHIFNKSVILYI